jgi:hypothetical protein
MASMLGLDDLVTAQRTMQSARLARERTRKEAQEANGRLLARLRVVDDERAQRAVRALGGKDWQLDQVEHIVARSAESGDALGDLDALRRLATLESPDPARAAKVAVALRDSAGHLRAARATAAARARDAAELLERALAFHEAHGDGDCPVCGSSGALHEDWRQSRLAEIRQLRSAAEAADAAHRQVVAARRATETLVNAPAGTALDRATSLGLHVEPVRAALEAWERGWAVEDPEALASHVDATIPPLCSALEALRTGARRELDRREDAWRPVAAELAAWLPRGRAAVRAAEAISLLAYAEQWLKEAAAEIRRERFAPIAAKAKTVWELLRRDSNVSLEEIGLAGQGTHRRVDLNVTVDGVEAAALGVMSQGELRALALSLFIPRASLPESPFRFLVIDDPVQSMDPARVDGLARALEMVARERQVIVLTHDDRLPQAVRDLAIDATVIEVTRREGSLVELRPARDPVSRHLDDAFALAQTNELPAGVTGRVIPGFCRLALEAACAAVVRRRRLTKGESHADVARLLDDAGRLTGLAALAFFDDRDRHAEVMGRINREYGPAAGDAFKLCNVGTHGVVPTDPLGFVRVVERLARGILSLR